VRSPTTMASCQTWASATSHTRHPWFDTTIMKRKHREIVSPDEEDTVSAPRAPLPKRRRCTNLEHGFSQMSLGISDLADIPVVSVEPPPATNVIDADMVPASSSTYASAPVHQIAYTVEEPVAPEVKMKTSSWYEPEPDRIVITDMDSFTEEDEEEDENVSINPALLDVIRSNTIETSTTTKTPAASTSQALVLFRPLPICDIKNEEERTREEEVLETKEGVADEDAMDVED